MAYSNSDYEELSEYKECREELSESDLEGLSTFFPGGVSTSVLSSRMARELYSPEVAAQILAIPVLRCGVTDKLMCSHTTQIWYTQAYDKQHVDQKTAGEYQGECVWL
ncbi:hypothetical protein SO802_001813 [Lithocarpus litseifolius]|uniref:Uncharacterized protein n=1 Tax=Lithocarpus litseifolius TaxID=425828 RepID=A0AAW2DXC2_9ROSI